jgi:hypothetical protein
VRTILIPAILWSLQCLPLVIYPAALYSFLFSSPLLLWWDHKFFWQSSFLQNADRISWYRTCSLILCLLERSFHIIWKNSIIWSSIVSQKSDHETVTFVVIMTVSAFGWMAVHLYFCFFVCTISAIWETQNSICFCICYRNTSWRGLALYWPLSGGCMEYSQNVRTSVSKWAMRHLMWRDLIQGGVKECRNKYKVKTGLQHWKTWMQMWISVGLGGNDTIMCYYCKWMIS